MKSPSFADLRRISWQIVRRSTIRDSSGLISAQGKPCAYVAMKMAYSFCHIMVKSVTPITLDALSDRHAEQEICHWMSREKGIKEIYPGLEQFYVIEFTRC